jgi:hypothetical protein
MGDITTILIMSVLITTILIMTILVTLNLGNITYIDMTYNSF